MFRNTEQWFLAQVRPNQQDRARLNLERQGYPCFVPFNTVTKRRGSRLVPSREALFPGYLFLNIGSDVRWHPVNSTYGVAGLLMRRAHVPQPVPDSIMADLFERTDQDGMILPPRTLKPGEPVRITRGPMTDFVAQVEKLSKSDRVIVLMNMMGQAVRTELPRGHVQLLAD